MKKLITVALASVLIFAVAAPTMAMHFEMNGQERVRSFYLNDYLADGESTEFVDQRFRLGLDWGLTDDVKLIARADILEGFWGNTRGTFTEASTTDPVTGITTSTTTFFQTDTKKSISFDHIYARFTFPNSGVMAQVGRQPVSFGHGINAKSDTRDRAKLVAPAGPGKLILAYDKFIESFEQNLVDNDIKDHQGFAVAYATGMGDWKGALLYYFSSNESGATTDTKVSRVAAFVTGAAGPATIKGEVGYIFGDTKTKGGDTVADITGLGLYGGAFFNAGAAAIGLEGAYASGDDDPDDKDAKAFTFDYDSAWWSVVLFNNLDYDGWAGTTRSGDRGPSNFWGVKGSATVKPMDKLSLTGAVVYAMRNEVPSGMDDDLGFEVDLLSVYNIYDNVSWTLGVGYLAAGDYFGDVNDPLAVMNALQVVF